SAPVRVAVFPFVDVAFAEVTRPEEEHLKMDLEAVLRLSRIRGSDRRDRSSPMTLVLLVQYR
ncbi:hypothetical protein DN539_34180, partial [Burkholderia multivorans]